VTIKEWMDSLDLSAVTQLMIKGVLAARYPGLMESDFGLKIDQEAGVMTILLNGEPGWVKTFEEVEDLANKKADIDGPADIVAGGPGIEPVSIPGQDPN